MHTTKDIRLLHCDAFGPDTCDFQSLATKLLRNTFNWHCYVFTGQINTQGAPLFDGVLEVQELGRKQLLTAVNYKEVLQRACQLERGAHVCVKLPPVPSSCIRFQLYTCSLAPDTDVQHGTIDMPIAGVTAPTDRVFQEILQQWGSVCHLPPHFNGPYFDANQEQVSTPKQLATLVRDDNVVKYSRTFVIRIGAGAPRVPITLCIDILPHTQIFKGSKVADGPVPTCFVLPREPIDNSISAFAHPCACQDRGSPTHAPKFIRTLLCFPDHQAHSPQAQLAFIDSAIGMPFETLERFFQIKGTADGQAERMSKMDTMPLLPPFLADNMFNFYGYGAKNAIGKMGQCWHMFTCYGGEAKGDAAHLRSGDAVDTALDLTGDGEDGGRQGEPAGSARERLIHHVRVDLENMENFKHNFQVYNADSASQMAEFREHIRESGFHRKVAEQLLLCAEGLQHFTALVATDLHAPLMAPMASEEGFQQFVRQLRDTYAFALGLYTPALQGGPTPLAPGKRVTESTGPPAPLHSLGSSSSSASAS